MHNTYPWTTINEHIVELQCEFIERQNSMYDYITRDDLINLTIELHDAIYTENVINVLFN